MIKAQLRDCPPYLILRLDPYTNMVHITDRRKKREKIRQARFYPPDQHNEFYFLYEKQRLWAYTI